MPFKGRLEVQITEKIADLLEGLEFGTIQITVHDSQITQIDRLEKYRIPQQKKTSPRIARNSNKGS